MKVTKQQLYDFAKKHKIPKDGVDEFVRYVTSVDNVKCNICKGNGCFYCQGTGFKKI